MRVNSINNLYYKQDNTNFRNWERVVYNPNKTGNSANKIQHRNTTWLLRPSVKYWQDLVLYLNHIITSFANKCKKITQIEAFDLGYDWRRVRDSNPRYREV